MNSYSPVLKFVSHILRTGLFISTLIVFSTPISAQPTTSEDTLDALVTNLKLNQRQETQLHKERELHFIGQRDKQQQLLMEQKQLRQKLKQEYLTLKTAVQEKNLLISRQKKALDEATHHLQDLFSLARQVAQDNNEEISTSLTSKQYPELLYALESFQDNEQIPSSKDLNALWLSMLNEIKASEEVTSFKSHYYLPSGDKYESTIFRAGPFTALADSQYLVLSDEDNSLSALQRSPEVESSSIGDGNSIDLLIDPTRGQLFKTLEREKSLLERIEQGGIVGHVIIALGFLGLIVTAFKVFQLSKLNKQIKTQLADPENISTGNPLGRVLAVGQAHQASQQVDEHKSTTSKANQEYQHSLIQGLEIKLNEAIMKEAPNLDKGSGFIKLLATVAPLLGLLGTVTGMIATFQAITLFGAGDPKLMAGGISQALVTTVLGLVVAIPLLFGHNMVMHRARSMLVVLSQESLALVAQAIDTPNSGTNNNGRES